MPLVKIIGAQPTTSAAAAAAVEAASYNRRRTDDIQANATNTIKLRRIIMEEEEDIQFFGKVTVWHDDTPEGVLAMRKIHTDFIVEVHLHALGFFVVSITQWILLYKIEAVTGYVKQHYHFALLPFALSFTMLITLVFFYDFITKERHIALFYTYTTIMLELSGFPLSLPLCASDLATLLCSGFISTVVILISIIIAHLKRDYYAYEPRFILAWTCRLFLIGSIIIIVGISLPSPYFDVVVNLIMMFLMSVYIFMCGRAISRAEFIWMDRYGPPLYGTLFYINYMTLFSMNTLFLEELETAYKLE